MDSGTPSVTRLSGLSLGLSVGGSGTSSLVHISIHMPSDAHPQADQRLFSRCPDSRENKYSVARARVGWVFTPQSYMRTLASKGARNTPQPCMSYSFNTKAVEQSVHSFAYIYVILIVEFQARASGCGQCLKRAMTSSIHSLGTYIHVLYITTICYELKTVEA
jgi:hypothetical protein